MKFSKLRKLSIILAALILLSVVFGGCSEESSSKKNRFVGTWFSDDIGVLWMFDDEGTVRELIPNSRMHRVSERTYRYTVNGNELSLEVDGDASLSQIYNFEFSGSKKLILKDPQYDNGRVVEFTRGKDSNSNEKSIVGTWTPIGYEFFDFHINNSGYNSAKSLNFYKDGTFRVITDGGEGSGEYTFLFDGEVLQMDSGWSQGQFDYELFGDEFMLIEYSIYNGEMQFGYLLKKEP